MSRPCCVWKSLSASFILIALILVVASTGCGSAGRASTTSSPIASPSPTPTPTPPPPPPLPGPPPPPPAPVTGGDTAPSVSIVLPQGNATVTGAIHVQATLSTDATLTLKLLLDGIEVWSTQAAAVDTTITAADGPHHLTVQATDPAGTTAEASVDFIAASAPADPPPPAYSVVLDRLEEQGAWLTCGSCGNAGGKGDVATYLMEGGITSPSTDGLSARFSIGGPYPYKNGYWYHKNTTPKALIAQLRYEFDLYIPADAAKAPQAIEFECQQTIGGYAYNFAWQAEFPNKIWRTFDYVNSVWVSTGIPMTQLTPGTWHHIVTESHTEDTTVVHDTLTIDGTSYAVGTSYPAKFVGGTGKQLTNAFQLDLNGTPTPYEVYVDGMKVSYK